MCCQSSICLGKKIRTLRNTKYIIVAAAVLHNLAITYRIPEPDDVINDLEDPDDPDDPEAQGNNIEEDELGQQPRAGRNIQGFFKRQQIIREYFA